VLSIKEKVFLGILGVANIGLMVSAATVNDSTEICNYRYQDETISVREAKRFEFPLMSGSLSGQWTIETTRTKYNLDGSQISNDIISSDKQSRYASRRQGYSDFNGDQCLRLAGLPHDYVPANQRPNPEPNNLPQEPPVDRELLASPLVQFALSLGLSEAKAMRNHRDVDKTATNKNGENLLFFALQEERDAELALQLLGEGIASNGVSKDFQVTPLMLAAGNSKPEVLQAVLAVNQNQIDFQSTQGASALMYAASAGREGNVRLLINAGANNSLRDKSGANAEEMARQQKFLPIAQLLEAAR
jgi:hypothetical protein